MQKIRKPAHGPEYHIQADIIKYLKDREWMVERMIGNAYQFGIPDLYARHRKWGERWIDVKNPGAYNFTQAQKIKWPLWESYNCGVWILTAANQEQYDKLFGPPNFRDYWKKSWGKLPDIDKLLDEIE